jgi:hypothetical protein
MQVYYSINSQTKGKVLGCTSTPQYCWTTTIASGNTITKVSDTKTFDRCTYGGVLDGVSTPGFMAAASTSEFAVSTTDSLTGKAITATWNGQVKVVNDMDVDPNNAKSIFVLTSQKDMVWYSSDMGANFQDITGNLCAANQGALAATTFAEDCQLGGGYFITVSAADFVSVNSTSTQAAVTALVVATNDGAKVAFIDQRTMWYPFSIRPHIPVTVPGDVEYSESGNVLLIATVGRGVYRLNQVRQNLACLKLSLLPSPMSCSLPSAPAAPAAPTPKPSTSPSPAPTPSQSVSSANSFSSSIASDSSVRLVFTLVIAFVSFTFFLV